MTWIYLAILAYFLDAVVFAVDKFLLVSPVPNPLSYAFYVSILSIFAIFLLPFGVHFLSLPTFAIAVLSGAAFFAALIYLYKSIKAIDILEATPAVGAFSAISTFLLAIFLVGEKISGQELIAFVLLVLGTLTMSYFHLKSRTVIHMAAAGIFFGVSYVALKHVFLVTDYINGLFWSRLGLVGGALSLLIFPGSRRQILGSFDVASSGSKFLFIINKVLAAAAFLILYYAIKIGSVVFVNALQGLQYVFILLAGIFLMKKMPFLFEKHVHEHFARKITATVLIIAGFFLLFV